MCKVFANNKHVKYLCDEDWLTCHHSELAAVSQSQSKESAYMHNKINISWVFLHFSILEMQIGSWSEVARCVKDSRRLKYKIYKCVYRKYHVCDCCRRCAVYTVEFERQTRRVWVVKESKALNNVCSTTHSTAAHMIWAFRFRRNVRGALKCANVIFILSSFFEVILNNINSPYGSSWKAATAIFNLFYIKPICEIIIEKITGKKKKS